MRLRTLRICVVVVYALLNLNKAAFAQCPDGSSPLTASYNTSEHINFGDASSTYTFPQFDPGLGTLLQVDVKAVINGQAVDYLENNLNTPTNYTVQIVRWDSISGPSLFPPLSNTANKNYGPFTLGASDNLGVPNFSGLDFIQLGPDILPNNKTLTRSITGAGLGPYIGTGTVSFNYKSSARAVITGSANNTNTIAASTDISMIITYTYCQLSLLPIENLKFNVRKTDGRNAKVSWVKENEQANTVYDVEMSEGGKEFKSIKTVQSVVPLGTNTANYEYLYAVPHEISGRILFRLRQTEVSGAVNFSEIISIEISLNDKAGMGMTIYPNPARQDINLQFSSVQNSSLLVELLNSMGQTVESTRLNGNSDLIRLNFKKQYPPGVYFVNVRNLATGEQTVNRIVIR